MPLREVLSAPLLSSEAGTNSDDFPAVPFYKVAAPGSADLAALAWPMPTSTLLRQAGDGWTRQSSPFSQGRKSSKQSTQSVTSDHERHSVWSSGASSNATHVTDVDCYWTRRKRLTEVLEESFTIVHDEAERDTGMSDGQNSLLISIVSLVSTCVGTGLLALPFCFYTAGFGLGAGLLFVFVITSGFGSYLLCQCCEWTGCYTYEDLMVAAFGKNGAVVMGIIVLWLLIGAMTSIVVVAADVVTHIMEAVLQTDSHVEPNGMLLLEDRYQQAWECRHTIVMLLNGLLVILPLSLKARSSAGLKYSNSIAVSCTSLVLLLLVAQGLFGFGSGEPETPYRQYHQVREPQPVPLVSSGASFVQVFRIVPIMMLSLGCQVQVPCVFGDLKHRSLPRMRQTLGGVGAVCFSSYSLVGTLGVVAALRLHAGDAGFAVTANILDSFPARAPLAMMMRGLMAVASTAVYPMLLLPCRSTLDHLIRVSTGASLEEVSSPFLVVQETLMIVGATLFFAYCGGNLAAVFGFTGATAGTLICYLLPSVCFLRLRRELPDEAEKRDTRGSAVACYCILACLGPLSLAEVGLQIFGY